MIFFKFIKEKENNGKNRNDWWLWTGSNFGFISANTPHIVFDRVNELSPIPLLSIVEETCKHVDRLALRRVGLLGTKFTVQSDFYQKVCDKYNIVVFVPNKEEQEYIHNKLITEIEFGIFLDETREGLLNIINRMIDEDLGENLSED
jgi:aspartate racemase